MPRNNGTKPVAGYYRISKERDGMIAPDIYESEIREYCTYKKLRLHEPLFHDVGISGRAEARHLRKGLDSLIARRHEFSAVVTPRLNRFGRSLKDLTKLFDIFDQDDIGLIFLDLDIDTRTSTGRLLRNIMASLAEFESDRISESWKATHEYLRRAGRTQGGGATPYGYLYYPKNEENLVNSPELAGTMVVIPEQAEVVRDIYDRYLSGQSLHAITNALNDGGTSTQRGGKWTRDVVGRILENPTYAGYRSSGDELIEAQWESIVERSVWEKAAALRKATKENARKTVEEWVEDPETGEMILAERTYGHRPKGSGGYLLTGLLYCGACGTAMHHKGNLYICPNRDCNDGGISAARAELLVDNAFGQHLSSEKVRERLVTPKRASKPRVSREKRLEEIDRQMDRLVSMAVNSTGAASQRSFEKKAAELEHRREEIEREQLEETAEQVSEGMRIRELHRFFGDVARHVPELWEEGPLSEEAEARYFDVLGLHTKEVSEQRRILEVVIERIETVPNTRPKELDLKWHGVKKPVRLSAPITRRWQKRPA